MQSVLKGALLSEWAGKCFVSLQGCWIVQVPLFPPYKVRKHPRRSKAKIKTAEYPKKLLLRKFNLNWKKKMAREQSDKKLSGNEIVPVIFCIMLHYTVLRSDWLSDCPLCAFIFFPWVLNKAFYFYRTRVVRLWMFNQNFLAKVTSPPPKKKKLQVSLNYTNSHFISLHIVLSLIFFLSRQKMQNVFYNILL